MPPSRQLIVNADDFGLTTGVNAGIVQAHAHGIVTSTSLMVRAPAAAAAAADARAHPTLGVGLHVDLGEWIYKDEQWRTAYQVVPLDDASAVAAEINRQLATFRNLLGRDPTHLDSHQHVHRTEPAKTIMRALARDLQLVLRDANPAVRYCGEFYGQSDKGYPYPEGITVDALVSILRALPPGITEMGCHPAINGDVDSTYARERAVECATLCDPRVMATIRAEGIALRPFSRLPE